MSMKMSMTCKMQREERGSGPANLFRKHRAAAQVCSARCVPVVRCLRKALGLWPPSEMAVWPGLLSKPSRLSGGTLGAGVGRDLMC